MTSPTTPEQLAAACEESAQAWANEIDTRVKAAAMLRTLSAELAQARAAIEGLKAQIQQTGEALAQIGDMAHHKSTGPAVPDALWEIRSMAYDAIPACLFDAAPPTGEV